MKKRKHRLLIIVVLIILFLHLLSSCTLLSGMSPAEFIDYVKFCRGDYDDNPEEYPNTRWVCQEVDMYFDNIEGSDIYVGKLFADGKEYDIAVSFLLGMAHSFELFHETESAQNVMVDGIKREYVLRATYQELKQQGETIVWVAEIDHLSEYAINSFEGWNYDGETLSFVMEELPKEDSNS